MASAPILRFSGERSKLMPKWVQNHQAESSFILLTPVFSYIFLRMLSTVNLEIFKSLATSLSEEPQAIRSAICVSLRVNCIIFWSNIPYIRNAVIIKDTGDCFILVQRYISDSSIQQ